LPFMRHWRQVTYKESAEHIKAKGHYGFGPGPVHADLVAEIRDLGAVVEVLEWSRTVNIVAESEEAEDAE